MKGKPYKVIFTLLILSVVAVLVLQGFWIRNFYIQKRAEFDQTIYAALEQITTKLKEQRGLRVIQKQLTLPPTSEDNKILRGKPVIPNNIYVELNHVKRTVAEITNAWPDPGSSTMREIKVTDSVIRIFKDGQTSVTKKEINGFGLSDAEINKLKEKLIMEIRVEDTDHINGDTLKNMVRKIFEGKGLFLPFEMAMKKIFHQKEELLYKSEGFKEGLKSYVSDLSANNVFSNHHFLFLQFPEENNYVLASIKNMLFLSLFFSLLIIGVFYYTMRLILRQKKLSEIKNDFVNNMTHELKTPIATNSLAIDAIANPLIKNDAEKFKDYIRILKEENQKLNLHVERVLQMALLDKGELPLNKSEVDLVEIIRTACKNYKLQVIQQNASIQFNPGTEPIIIHGDAQHLQTVFSNLIDNALKYAKASCVIEIEIKHHGKEIVIHVKDNGIGIDKVHAEKIFDKFYRIQGGNLHDVKGFGLGLTYVKSIVEAHGGSIELKSELGRGSEFILSMKKI